MQQVIRKMEAQRRLLLAEVHKSDVADVSFDVIEWHSTVMDQILKQLRLVRKEIHSLTKRRREWWLAAGKKGATTAEEAWILEKWYEEDYEELW